MGFEEESGVEIPTSFQLVDGGPTLHQDRNTGAEAVLIIRISILNY